MRCNEDQLRTIKVTPGADVNGDLSGAGVLRFERDGDAMKGRPEICVEDGAYALRYADGSTVTIKT